MNEFWWALAGCGVFWLVLVWGLGRWDRKKSLAPLAEKDGMLDHAMLLAALRAADAKDQAMLARMDEQNAAVDFFNGRKKGETKENEKI